MSALSDKGRKIIAGLRKATCKYCGKPHGKVIAINEIGNGRDSAGQVVVELTETAGAYRKGEKLTLSTFQAVPVKQEIKPKTGQYFRRVNTLYQFVK